ncbi:MAG TPA: hypothetical protein VGD72_12635 [Mycobacteriales bacterium]|jgi:hypothetical protein
MSDGYRVDLAELEGFAARADERRAQLSTATCTLAAAAVGPDSFGRIPVVADRIRGAYEQHLHGCETGVRTALEVAGAVAAATRRLHDNYASPEYAAGSDMAIIDETLGGHR